MEDFKEVSLGFAEFVSQLIQETFEAILSSQNYQLEKYLEIESKLNLPNEKFIKEFINVEQIDNKEVLFFGFKLVKQMKIDDNLKEFIIKEFGELTNIVYKSKLTVNGYTEIRKFITNLIITEQKDILNHLLNKSNATSLVVDSGEINAKLELSNLYSNDNTSVNQPKKELKSKKIDLRKSKYSDNRIVRENILKPIKITNVFDEKTKISTIFIDKKDIENSNNFSISALRLIAKPVKMSSSSNLFTEIKINFKTV